MHHSLALLRKEAVSSHNIKAIILENMRWWRYERWASPAKPPPACALITPANMLWLFSATSLVCHFVPPHLCYCLATSAPAALPAIPSQKTLHAPACARHCLQVLAEAQAKLQEVVCHKVDAAAASGDHDGVLQYVKLFVPLGLKVRISSIATALQAQRWYP